MEFLKMGFNTPKRILKNAIESGLTLKVYYEDDLTLDGLAYYGNDLNKAWEECKACEMATVKFFSVVNGFRLASYGWMLIIHNNGDAEENNLEDVADYSENGFADNYLKMSNEGKIELSKTDLKRLDQLSRKCLTNKGNLKGQFKQALDFKLIDQKFYNEHTDSNIRFNNLKLNNLHFNSIKKEILDRDILFDE